MDRAEFLNLTLKELITFLKEEKGVDNNLATVLQAESIDGKLFLKLTRDDINDLYAGQNFRSRKAIWDIILSLNSKGDSNIEVMHTVQRKSVTPPPRKASLGTFSDTCSIISTCSQDTDSDDIQISPSDTASSAQTLANENLWKDFHFPYPHGMKADSEITDSTRKQVIRNVYTCMLARANGKELVIDDFTAVAKRVC
ncbi:hypothetical protein AC249_AIPGENE24637 [Exaiptasia diaphana]|nr:hypothetical protein AC249_AIPGENE24637 [Exaiptasia diaphana]